MEQHTGSAPFEGPEKLLEIWFAPSPAHLPDTNGSVDGKIGLRKVERAVWEGMLDIVKCSVLSTVSGADFDAYLLSESSLFVSPHRLILKTCGTTLNLLGLPRILEIAAVHADLHTVYRCFYSRKSFMFPDRQHGPHRDWKYEVEFLDNIFANGAAYTVGKVNGDHWLLYLTNPEEEVSPSLSIPPAINTTCDLEFPDYTIEILMSDLSPSARERFFLSSPTDDPTIHAAALSQSLGIAEIFPPHLTTLDAYSFSPCGYSSNALIKWGEDSSFVASPNSVNTHPGEGYYTIHVTPEEGWSYASFECNVPLPPSRPSPDDPRTIPDLKTLIQRVVSIFEPGRLTLTLFISCEENEVDLGERSPVEAAQQAFRAALGEPVGKQYDKVNGIQPNGLSPRRYKRTDKINYEFGGYDLAFASFELVS
ncbi:related to S-adenosylmethionine decarboxylase [Armillaria ostoyae]|uniref:adenosylmethionine decarboxylase n=1 Tax=Armillaria ostoyae TaxID=47428 RepID=A0A284QLL8_ARMOS|nr:related to S-adenosylmethionine decarboxylase [Armillaria ostoyae]